MDRDDGAVQRHRLEPDAQELFALQVSKDPVEHPILGPAIHPGVDGVPVAEPLRYAPPLAALLGDIQDGIEHLPVRQTDIARCTGRQGAIRAY